MGIKNCKHKGLEELYVTGKTTKINLRFQKNILYILDHLAGITELQDCVGVKDFHALKGVRKGTYSMHVNKNYCITFQWEDGQVVDVNFKDYH